MRLGRQSRRHQQRRRHRQRALGEDHHRRLVAPCNPFAEAAAELFNQDNPDVEITVGAAGTSGGFEKFCAGETDISDASRPIEPEEVDACKKGGVSYSEFQVANDGIAIVTNPALEISCLTTDQLAEAVDRRLGHQLQPAR